jgi:uncharacterized RDD family membrane protein YckC
MKKQISAATAALVLSAGLAAAQTPPRPVAPLSTRQAVASVAAAQPIAPLPASPATPPAPPIAPPSALAQAVTSSPAAQAPPVASPPAIPAQPNQPPPAAAPAEPDQPPSAATPAEPPTPPDVPTADTEPYSASSQRNVFRIGQNYRLNAGERLRDLVVILGDATIDSTVDGDVVVIMGAATLESSAAIRGSLVVVGGRTRIAAGAQVRRDLTVVGGTYDAPPDFAPGGEHVVISPALLGASVAWVEPWLKRGLLWGRPIVPDLPGLWAIAGLFFLFYLAVNLLFHRAAAGCAAMVTTKPLTAFGVGLLVLLLAGPVCLLLIISVLGLAIVPFVFCALLVGGIIGHVGVARSLGSGIIPQNELDSRLQSLRSFLAGSALICLAYTVPALGIIVWAMTHVMGLGAAALEFISSYRRENPAVRPAVIPAAVPAAAPLSPVYAGAAPMPPAEMSLPIPDNPSTPPPPPPMPGAAAPAVALTTFPHASFRDRLAAGVLDLILVILVNQILVPRVTGNTFLLTLLVYHVGFWTWKGTTLGGIICRLRVVRADGAPLQFIDALVRGLTSLFSLAVVGLGFLWILRDPERQAWHDRIAGTFVVIVPRNWPL